MMDNLRLFVAIEIPDDARQELGKLQDRLRQNGLASLKWVAPENIHLTLKFLGYVKPAMTEGLKEAIERSSAGCKPFDIALKGLGVFPSLSRAQVLWAGLSGQIGGLQMLAERVEAELSRLGFAREKRLFNPHLTLARVKSGLTPVELQVLAEAVGKTGVGQAAPVRVNSISLMQSNLTPAGAVYTRLHHARLRAKPA